ncbi:hypothetical protein [Hymenobacter swuensis]|uniref:hypothetical protein n=1 Tax=Hymenobacter swuensis TaxID=1446467 RepID=UPI0005C546BF|nr:hypothetical protein [Hymenobacter swuensis]
MIKKSLLLLSSGIFLSAITAKSLDYAFIKDLYFNFVSIVAGLILGAVGVFTSSITIIYTYINKKHQNGDIPLEKKLHLNQIAKDISFEIKENTLYTIYFYCTGLLFVVLQNTDIPIIEWPFKPEYTYLSKKLIYGIIIFTCIPSMILTTVDTINAMFKLQEVGDL